MSKSIGATSLFYLCTPCSELQHASYKYKYTASVMRANQAKNLIKCFNLVPHTSPMPCYFIAMQIVHHSSWHDCLLVAFYSYACALYLCWPLFVWFFFEQTLSRGYIKKPRSTTQIRPSLQLSCQASTTTCLHTYSTYCLYLILASLSRDCIKLNPKYCIAFTFKPHRSLFLHPMSHYYRSCLSHASRRTACVGYVSV